uniref:Peptidase M20 domain-containing protein 2 n=1 Tax=Oryzias latipes TaxID=8090 RepID=A0A3P9HRU6_ORYLA
MEKLQQMKDTLQIHIDSIQDELNSLSQDIWSHPELAGNETKAHDRLVRFFSQRDGAWTVESHFKLPTAFRASWGPVGGGPKEGNTVLNVGFLCEYDALPDLGHACGHNLIAEVGAAAAVGLKAALDDISVVTVKYHGKASHASAYPWEGVNALDAAVLAYNNLSALRQQLKPEWRLHGIIKNGGVKPNIIPAYAELEFYLRTPLLKDLLNLKAKAEACFRAAALATGCQVEIIYPSHTYYNILPNATLANLYESNGKTLGIEFPEQPDFFSGSTDFGNVSFIVPGIHAFFSIGSAALNHTKEYTEAAGAEKAQLFTLRTAKALAMTAVDVVCRPDLLQQTREDFSRAKLKQENPSETKRNKPSSEIGWMDS